MGGDAVNLGALRQRVLVENPTATVPDGDGGFTQTWTSASPAYWWASMAKATQRASERLFAATVIAHATHIFDGRFHAGLTRQTRLTWTDRAGVSHVANVLDLDDVDGAGKEIIVLVSEVAP